MSKELPQAPLIILKVDVAHGIILKQILLYGRGSVFQIFFKALTVMM